ncbi:GfV-B16-ORF1 [Ichnoviriform fumiferanae]|uniref:GfV-B16-ORF1 n=1 Tax=Ichnoviriform fumiferanae TaxID=419435 RepID=A2PZR5_9VIRU|nr:GfV-B16-ORF1 [Ichnoviriform fumiferanae]BAF45487.1 GfV-B16-ORF1 [Ichnoviriform fumiferanae]
MYCVVDVLGFKQSGEKFILKEFAMIIFDGETMKHWEFVVKPPYPFDNLLKEHQIMNLWMTRNVHGISWDSGTITHEESKPYIRKILKKARTIYVRGSEKKKWLQSVLGFSVHIVDLKKHECPSTMKLKELLGLTCAVDQYAMGFESAGENVKLIRRWMLQTNIIPESKENNCCRCPFSI